MKLLRGTGIFLSVLLIPALVLNPAPAHAIVYPAGSLDTSWASGGYANFGVDMYPALRGSISDTDGGLYVPVTVYDGFDQLVGIQSMGPNGTHDGLFASIEDTQTIDFVSATDLDFDGNGRFVLVTETGQGIAFVRFTSSGNLDTSFSTDGISFPAALIQDRILATSPYNGLTRSNIGIYYLDFGVGADGSVYLLGQVRITGNSANDTNLALWRFLPNGDLDTAFSGGVDKGLRFTSTEGYVPGTFQGTGVLNFDSSGTEITVVAKATVPSDVLQPDEFYIKKLDVTNGAPITIPIISNSYLLTALDSSWEDSGFIVYDAAETESGRLFIVGEECYYPVGNTSCNWYSSAFRVNLNSGVADSVQNVAECYNDKVVIDQSGQAIIAGHCDDANSFYGIPSLIRVKANGILDESFIFEQQRFGATLGNTYSVTGMHFSGGRVLVVGSTSAGIGGCNSGIGISGCSLSGTASTPSISSGDPLNALTSSGNFFATAFRTSSLTVADPPPPAPAPAPAPAPVVAPVVAPALPAQSAPVSVPAIVKAKKKLSFPLVSSAGNTLIVGVSGSCSLSPVFKKVKVKVGKKTKKVKQQTGWTVQMKKKKQTCTITQTDAGGNGYAALSSTSTVTIN